MRGPRPHRPGVPVLARRGTLLAGGLVCTAVVLLVLRLSVRPAHGRVVQPPHPSESVAGSARDPPPCCPLQPLGLDLSSSGEGLERAYRSQRLGNVPMQRFCRLGVQAPQNTTEHTLAVLIPYRDRQEHLQKLMPALRTHLDEQKLTYDIFIVEQVRRGDDTRVCRVTCWCWAPRPTISNPALMSILRILAKLMPAAACASIAALAKPTNRPTCISSIGERC